MRPALAHQLQFKRLSSTVLEKLSHSGMVRDLYPGDSFEAHKICGASWLRATLPSSVRPCSEARTKGPTICARPHWTSSYHRRRQAIAFISQVPRQNAP